MDYPKHIFLLWLIIVFLLGFILLSLNWITYTVFIGMFVCSLPVFWLETKMRNTSIRRQTKAGKFWMIRFKEWNWDRLFYYEFVAFFVLTLPGLFFDLTDVNWLQAGLAYTFIIGLLASKYYREQGEQQSIQLDGQRLIINNFGVLKKLLWRKIKHFKLVGDLLTIGLQGNKTYVLNLQTLEPGSREVLLERIAHFVQKKDIPFTRELHPAQTTNWSRLRTDWWKGILFFLFLIWNILILVG